jgi:hypothetical protein
VLGQQLEHPWQARAQRIDIPGDDAHDQALRGQLSILVVWFEAAHHAAGGKSRSWASDSHGPGEARQIPRQT